MKRLKLLIATFAVAMFGVFALAPIASVSAYDPLTGVCPTNADGSPSTSPSAPDTEICSHQNDDGVSLIGTIVNVLLFIVGALAVIMIIVSGIFYVTSSGDSGKVARAKNTLMYSIVGLVISFLAFAIINWVVKLF